MAIVWLDPLDGADPFIRWHRSMSEGPCYSICLPTTQNAVAPLPSYSFKVVEFVAFKRTQSEARRLGHGALHRAIENLVSAFSDTVSADILCLAHVGGALLAANLSRQT